MADKNARPGIVEGKPIENKAPEVESNHNTIDPAKPVPTANITDEKIAKPDYNPMRREGSRANVQSDTSMNRDDNEQVVAEKGDRPSAAEVEAGKDIPEAGTETEQELRANGKLS